MYLSHVQNHPICLLSVDHTLRSGKLSRRVHHYGFHTTKQVGCKYSQLDNDIHKFEFTGVGTTGLDELFGYLQALWSLHSSDETLRYIVDTTNSNGQASMVQLLRRFQELDRNMSDRPNGRTAIVHNPDALVSLADSFVRTFAPKRDRSRFLKKGKKKKRYNGY